MKNYFLLLGYENSISDLQPSTAISNQLPCQLVIIIIYLICQKTGWHQNAKPVLGCFLNHAIQKQTIGLTVQGQNNYTEQLQTLYVKIIQVQKHNKKIITII